MKRLITLLLFSLILIGCSKKTHSGVYESIKPVGKGGNINTVTTFDFRNDGTVTQRYVSTGIISLDETKKGTYEIRGDVIHVDIEGAHDEDIERKWNQFKIEGSDLIWLGNDERLKRK